MLTKRQVLTLFTLVSIVSGFSSLIGGLGSLLFNRSMIGWVISTSITCLSAIIIGIKVKI